MISLDQHFNAPGPKRILALDGGGIRGAFTLGYLQRIEDMLRKQHGNNPAFRLCDYFDLIGGTSTGAIIAACLAVGQDVATIKKMYMELGGKIFGRKYNLLNPFQIANRLKAGYDSEPLKQELRKAFGDITLGSPEIKTGLCIVAKRADTNSVWPMLNHPKGKYYSSEHGNNNAIPLWQAVRASTAAPTYFIPEVINVGGGMPKAAFVDGGMSMANNPAMQLLMVATLRGFPFRWKMGTDKLLLTSVGTGMGRWDKLPDEISGNNLLKWASQIPDMFMQDMSWHNQTILQWLANSPTAVEIDGETGDLSDDYIISDPTKQSLLTYLRYNLWFDAENLKQATGKAYDKERIEDLLEMSHADNRFELFDIGVAAANSIQEAHFPDAFKVSLS